MTDSEVARPPSLGLLRRVVGVVVSPAETFQDVVRNPRPVGVLLLVALVLGLALGAPQFTERGRHQAIEVEVQQIERMTGQPVTPQMHAAIEGRAPYSPFLTMGSLLVFLPVISLLFAALYWALFNVAFGGTATLKQVLGIVTHAQVIGALGAVVGAPIRYLQETPQTTSPFSLGALVPMADASAFLSQWLGWVDLIVVWQLVITAVGLAVLYRRRFIGMAIFLVLAYLALTASVIGAMSAFRSR